MSDNKRNLIQALKLLRALNKSLPSEDDDDKYLKSIGFKFFNKQNELEFLLSIGIFIVSYRNRKKELDYMLVTSNTPLIKTFNTEKLNDKMDTAGLRNVGIHSTKAGKVLTWDLIDNSLKTISLNNYKIVFKILTRPEKSNILALDAILTELLK